MRHWARIVSLIGLLVTAGCSTQGSAVPGLSVFDPIGYEIVDRFDSPHGKGALRRNRLDGTFDLQPGPDFNGIPVAGLTRVDSVHHLTANGKLVLLVDGASTGCEKEHIVLALDSSLHSWHIGDCKDALTVAPAAKHDLLFTEKGGADPTLWIWQSSAMTVTGPFKQSYWTAQQRQILQKLGRQDVPPAQDYHVADPGAPPLAPVSDSIVLPPILVERESSRDIALWKLKADQP